MGIGAATTAAPDRLEGLSVFGHLAVHIGLREAEADEEAQSARRAAGCTAVTLSTTDAGNGTTDVAAVVTFANRSNAEAFLADPGLAEAMKAGGVVGPPSVSIMDHLETVTY